MLVFLGGTCTDNWREDFIKKLEKYNINYFNPVVEDWTEECIKKENEIKNLPETIELYVITPKMKGVYSIAEAVYRACKNPEKVIFCVKDLDKFPDFQQKSLKAVINLLLDEKVPCFYTLNGVLNFLKLLGGIE